MNYDFYHPIMYALTCMEARGDRYLYHLCVCHWFGLFFVCARGRERTRASIALSSLSLCVVCWCLCVRMCVCVCVVSEW